MTYLTAKEADAINSFINDDIMGFVEVAEACDLSKDEIEVLLQKLDSENQTGE